MKELEMWCMFGHGRKLALCEKIGCSRLAVLSEMSAPTMKKILIGQLDCSDDQWARILNAFELMT